MVDDTISVVPGHLSVAQVATRLAIAQNTVRSLIAAGELPAERVGRMWMIPIEAVDRRRSQGSRDGRRFSASNAWAILYMAAGMPVPWIDRHTRWRLREYLATHRLPEMRPRLVNRGQPRSFRAHSGVIETVRNDPVLMLTGPAAASELRLGLVGGTGGLEAYVAVADLAPLASRHHLRPSTTPNVTLRVVSPVNLPWPPARVAPISAVALDLLDHPEPRAQQVGERVLGELDRAIARPSRTDR